MNLTERNRHMITCLLLVLGTFLVVYLPNKFPANYHDYSRRIGEAMMEGRLGMNTEPPDWLPEMIPENGRYYSAFPLGNIISILPFAVIQKLGWVHEFPARFIAAGLGSLITLLAFLLSAPYRIRLPNRIILALAPFFGTCLWANVAYGGSWQIAIGIAVAAELAAFYFLLVSRRPWLAGLFFSIAFGNRTEIILTAPVFYYLLARSPLNNGNKTEFRPVDLIAFSAIPFVLGILTLWYNYARFSNPCDFGYSRIPGVLSEANYIHGLFSPHAIPNNVYRMFFQPWKFLHEFPWVVPMNSGGSVFLYSPWLILVFLRGGLRTGIIIASWGAALLLLVVLCLHGDPGGLQISSRYAMIMVPWMYLIVLEKHATSKIMPERWLIFTSVIINAWAMWLFCTQRFFYLYRECRGLDL